MLQKNDLLGSKKCKMNLDPNEWKKYKKKTTFGVTVDSVDSKPEDYKWETTLKFDKK